jgi:hypothetical protein
LKNEKQEGRISGGKTSGKGVSGDETGKEDVFRDKTRGEDFFLDDTGEEDVFREETRGEDVS